MIMANDDIEIFGNTITGNQSGGIYIVSYYIMRRLCQQADLRPGAGENLSSTTTT